MPAKAKKTFFITGVSSGFGRALSEAALAAGHCVVGTLRDERARAEFDGLKPAFSFGRLLDVTDEDFIIPAVAEIETNVGAIDVLVNNAGYGHEGTIEEFSYVGHPPPVRRQRVRRSCGREGGASLYAGTTRWSHH